MQYCLLFDHTAFLSLSKGTHLLIIGVRFRASVDLTVTGRSFPPARFALALPEAECPTMELVKSLRSPVYAVDSLKPSVENG